MIAAVTKKIRKKVDLAAALDTSLQSIDKWTRHAEFPGGRNGPWSVDRVRVFLSEQGSNIAGPKDDRRGSATPGGGQVAQTKSAAEALKMREQYRKLKLQNDILEGKLVYRDEVLQAAAILIVLLKTRLESLPDEIEMHFPLEVRAVAKEEMKTRLHFVLKEIAAWCPIEAE